MEREGEGLGSVTGARVQGRREAASPVRCQERQTGSKAGGERTRPSLAGSGEELYNREKSLGKSTYGL
jgi:hypothetical protein